MGQAVISSARSCPFGAPCHAVRGMSEGKNVLGGPLKECCRNPMAGFFRVFKPGGVLLFAESTRCYIH